LLSTRKVRETAIHGLGKNPTTTSGHEPSKRSAPHHAATPVARENQKQRRESEEAQRGKRRLTRPRSSTDRFEVREGGGAGVGG